MSISGVARRGIGPSGRADRLLRPLILAWLALLVPSSPVRAQGAASPAAGAVNPGRIFLSIDYEVHDSFRGAVYRSFSPTNLRANTGAVLRNTVDPLNPFRYVTSVLAIEAQKQIASGEGLDVSKLVQKIDVKALSLGYLGAQGGELAGAAVQSLLAKSIGPVGGLVGFTLRPVLWYLGSNIGQEAGKSLGKGGDPLKNGFGVALREYNPVQDTLQMVGDNVGGVIGQALIPIPLVGNMVGGAVGGVTGLLLSKWIDRSEAGKGIDEMVRRRFGEVADGLAGPPAPGSPESTTVLLVPVIRPTGRPGTATAGSAATGPAAPGTSVGSAGAPLIEQARNDAYRDLIARLRLQDLPGAARALEAYGGTNVPGEAPSLAE